MSLCSLAMGNMTMLCKYKIDHRLEQCPFCELELRVKALEGKEVFSKKPMGEIKSGRVLIEIDI